MASAFTLLPPLPRLDLPAAVPQDAPKSAPSKSDLFFSTSYSLNAPAVQIRASSAGRAPSSEQASTPPSNLLQPPHQLLPRRASDSSVPSRSGLVPGSIFASTSQSAGTASVVGSAAFAKQSGATPSSSYFATGAPPSTSRTNDSALYTTTTSSSSISSKADQFDPPTRGRKLSSDYKGKGKQVYAQHSPARTSAKLRDDERYPSYSSLNQDDVGSDTVSVLGTVPYDNEHAVDDDDEYEDDVDGAYDSDSRVSPDPFSDADGHLSPASAALQHTLASPPCSASSLGPGYRPSRTGSGDFFLPLCPLEPLQRPHVPRHRYSSSDCVETALRRSRTIRTSRRRKERSVSFRDDCEVVDVFAAIDYPARRGPPPIERLTMRDVLELRQIKIELGVFQQRQSKQAQDSASSSDPRIPATKVSEPCADASSVVASTSDTCVPSALSSPANSPSRETTSLPEVRLTPTRSLLSSYQFPFGNEDPSEVGGGSSLVETMSSTTSSTASHSHSSNPSSRDSSPASSLDMCADIAAVICPQQPAGGQVEVKDDIEAIDIALSTKIDIDPLRTPRFGDNVSSPFGHDKNDGLTPHLPNLAISSAYFSRSASPCGSEPELGYSAIVPANTAELSCANSTSSSGASSLGTSPQSSTSAPLSPYMERHASLESDTGHQSFVIAAPASDTLLMAVPLAALPVKQDQTLAIPHRKSRNADIFGTSFGNSDSVPCPPPRIRPVETTNP